MIIAFFTLLTALTLSVVAAYYSIVGLTAIFAAAVLPIVIMGGVLEVSKIVTTVWLHKNWPRTPILIRTYLMFAVLMLMFITSIGIFGFLSKAHLDQTIAPGDFADKLEIIDQRIVREKDTITRAQANITILDKQIAKYTSLGAVTKGLKARAKQQPEREKIYGIIEKSQEKISNLREERIPLTKKVRAIEAEVGPLKYIAALIYGDNPGNKVLEKAVRWVIIILVSVFDPLAIILLLAANKSIMWSSADKRKRRELKEAARAHEIAQAHAETLNEEEFIIDLAKLKNEEKMVNNEVIISKEPSITLDQADYDIPGSTYSMQYYGNSDTVQLNDEVYTHAVRPEITSAEKYNDNYVTPVSEDEHTLKAANRTLVDINAELATEVDELKDALIKLVEQPNIVAEDTDDAIITRSTNDTIIGFGAHYPKSPRKGNMFLRTDYLPTKLFRYNGGEWEEAVKDEHAEYVFDDAYINHLVKQISRGEYDPDLLSDAERLQIETNLKNIDL